MNDEQLLRYSRHIMLPGLDIAGQERLLAARVLVVGLGGLGCPVALYLAAAGVGELWLADHDRIDLANLQRQIAYTTADVGRLKTEVMAERLHALNPDLAIRLLPEYLTAKDLQTLASEVDLVVDATDNFATRFALNAACYSAATPLVSGAAIRAEGQVAVFDHRQAAGPCYRCLYDEQVSDTSLSCSESGVLGPLVGLVGSMQALEAVKLLAGYGEPLRGRLLLLDAAVMQWRQLTLAADPACPVCAH